MTTIIFDKKRNQIAVDSRMTNPQGVIFTDNSDKTIKNDIGVWFCAGVVSNHVDIVKLSHNEECKIVPESIALLIKDGCVYQVAVSDSGICAYEKQTTNDGIGSGYKFALSALDFGKSAKEAVEYAATKDCFTGGKVRVFCTKTGEEIIDKAEHVITSEAQRYEQRQAGGSVGLRKLPI